MVPRLEAKMIHHYDTRWATYGPNGSTHSVTLAEKADDTFHVTPRYWVAETEVDRKLDGRWDRTWLLGCRDICRATDARTFITTSMPRTAIPHKVLLALPKRGQAEQQTVWPSFAFGYVTRQKLGGTSMAYFTFMQLPMPSPDQIEACPITLDLPTGDWIGQWVDRLNARPAMDNAEARATWRAELDALICHLFGLDRNEVDYILGTFAIVKRQDEAAHGEDRTKRLILAAYDEMQHARTTGQIYTSITVEAR